MHPPESANLFDPLQIRGAKLPNRIAMSPMIQTSAVDGFASDWHLVHLGSRAVGGVALVLAEATAIHPSARVTINDLGIWHDDHIPGLRKICDFLHSEGAVAGIQLAHGGRRGSKAPPFDRQGRQPMRQLTKSEGAWAVKAASAIPYSDDSAIPIEMTISDIEEVLELYAQAADRAHRAGFDWIEIHAAHGYLPHCFYSPISNSRTDQYGGTFENRIRLARQIARRVREALPPEKVLAFRISYTDWVDGGWALTDAIELSRLLKTEGVDLIDVSSGGATPTVAYQQLTAPSKQSDLTQSIDRAPVARIPLGPGYQVPGAKAIRNGAGIPVAAVGLITEAAQANTIIRDGDADLVMLGRSLLRDPYWPLRAAIQLQQTRRVRLPIQYAFGWRDIAEFAHVPISAPLL